MNDTTIVGNTFLDDLFESQNFGNTSLQFSKMGDFGEIERNKDLINNSKISRILPVNEQSNSLEESSGLLKHLEISKKDSNYSSR